MSRSRAGAFSRPTNALLGSSLTQGSAFTVAGLLLVTASFSSVRFVAEPLEPSPSSSAAGLSGLAALEPPPGSASALSQPVDGSAPLAAAHWGDAECDDDRLLAPEPPLLAAEHFAELPPGWAADPSEPAESVESGQSAGDEPLTTREGKVAPGQTIAVSLRGQGLNNRQVHEIVTALEPLFDFRRTPAGACYDFCTRDDRVERFCFRPNRTERLEATRGEDGQFAVRRVEADLDTRTVELAARIDSSLYEAIAAAGESPALASRIAEVFAWDLDFSRDQQPGDRFRMIVERVEREGELVRYGRVLAAEYAGRRDVYRAFWFDHDDDGQGHYYLEDGRSAEKTFLATPVEYSRVSSRFSPRRRHPILGFTRAHNGTDFAAPTGTPVRSLADGVVRFSGRKGAAGKLVVIDHEDGLRSYYMHLHRIDSSVRRGARVRQKQVIGQVGSTGRSTGPHLHLGIKRDGRWIDPQKLKIQRRESVPESQLARFRSTVAERRERLAALAVDEPDVRIASAGGRDARELPAAPP